MTESAAVALDGDIAGLQAAYADGLSPVDVIDEVLRRIGDADDPAIWIATEDAGALRRAARDLDPSAQPTLPLWGVPFGVKDYIDVAGRTTTGGVPGLTRMAARSATVVDRLVAAGALYVGKTNLDQLATGLVGTRSPYGTPRNPFDPDLIPGGSSSGSAVAVALRQVAFTLGTDTAGSGRVPAALCGVVGLKRAPGALPTDGVWPASPTIDCVSTFAGSVADGLAVEGVLAGQAWPIAGGPFRVAMAQPGGSAAELLAAQGHEVTEADLTLFHEAGDLLYTGPWLADRTAALAPLIDLFPEGLGDVVQRVVARGEQIRGTEVFDALRLLERIRSALAPWWTTVDALVVPTVELVPTLAEVEADPIEVNVRLGRNTTFANLLGLVAIAVPAPTGPGGVTVLGPPSHAGAVAALAAALCKEELPATAAPPGLHHLAVVGAHLRGQPLNHQLTDRGATLVERARTAPSYRMYHLGGGPPMRPGLDRVGRGGAEIEVEVWSLDDAGLGAVTAAVTRPLGIGSIELNDGRWVKGFVCEPYGLADATDITEHGGWRAYLEAVNRRSAS